MNIINLRDDGEEPALTQLGIYLNDHIAGATAGLELFRRVAGYHDGTPMGERLKKLTAEVEQDREALLDMTAALGIPIRRYKVWGGWLAEKAGRLKPNGHLVSRAPVSSLIEFEGLVLGVTGKSAGWRVLRKLADQDQRLDPAKLDQLILRARAQGDELEDMRMATAAELFAVAKK